MLSITNTSEARWAQSRLNQQIKHANQRNLSNRKQLVLRKFVNNKAFGEKQHPNDDVIKWKHFLLLALCAGKFTSFLWSVPEQTIKQQSRRQWFESPSCSSWLHCNAQDIYQRMNIPSLVPQVGNYNNLTPAHYLAHGQVYMGQTGNIPWNCTTKV